MLNLGVLIKEFRKERNLTQKDLCSGLVSRETIAKLETTNQHTSFLTVFELLRKMEISLSEFQMKLISNDEDDFAKLIVLFADQLNNSSDTDLLKEINKLSYSLYRSDNNKTAYRINIVSKLMLLLNNYDGSKQKLDSMRELAEPIWYDMQFLDSWTMIDIRILKSVLFLFDPSVAEQITETICWAIDKRYKSMQSVKLLCWINLSYCFILSNKYDKALVLLTKIKQESILFYRYDIKILADIRSIYLEQNSGWQDLLQDKYDMLNDLGAINFRKSIEKEVIIF